MFVKFNYDNFPKVTVVFGKLESDDDFNILINEWMRLYSEKKEFEFEFDTSNLEVYNIKYCFKMASFIHKLKKEPVQYLQRSTIIVKNSFIHRLLDLIFFIQSPVAPVEIIKDY